MAITVTKDSNFEDLYSKAKTYQTDVANWVMKVDHYCAVGDKIGNINFSDWNDDASTLMQTFCSNMATGYTALENGCGNAFGENLNNLVTALNNCKTTKQTLNETRNKKLDVEIHSPRIKNPNYMPISGFDFRGNTNVTDEYIPNPLIKQYEGEIKTLEGDLDGYVSEANGYISALSATTFDETGESGNNGGGSNGNSGGNNNGGNNNGGNNNGDAPDDNPNSPFTKDGLNGMTEADAYPDGNLNHGATVDIQYTDINGDVHDAKLTFNGNARNPADPGSWSITQTNPDGTTSSVPSYAIGMNDDGSYQINVYKPSSSAVSSDSKKQDFKERQLDERTPAPSSNTKGSKPDLTSSNPRSQYYDPDGVEPHSNNPRAPENRQTGQHATDTSSSKPAAPASSSSANSADKREQVASEMGIRDQVSLMDNVHTSNVRFTHNDDEVYLQRDDNNGDYGLFNAKGERIEGYSFSHDQVTQAQYDENNWATYPDVEDAVVDYFVSIEE